MKKIAMISLVALAAWLVHVLIEVISHHSASDPEALYWEQLRVRGYSGKVRRQDAALSPQFAVSDYDEKVRRITSRAALSRTVIASWYGGDDGFVGRCKANGDFFDDTKFTVAHRELPLGTLIALEKGGRFALAMVTDRGPYVRGRELDVSRAVAERLGIGVSPVTMFVLRVPERNVTFHRENPRCLKP